MTVEEVIARAIHEGFRTSSSDGWVDTLYDPIMDTVIDGSFDLREVSRAILSAIRAAGLVIVPESHIEEAYRLLNGEAYRVTLDNEQERVDHFCTIATDLRRIDAAIGSSGSTPFSTMAETVQAVFVEIIAARAMIRAATGREG